MDAARGLIAAAYLGLSALLAIALTTPWLARITSGDVGDVYVPVALMIIFAFGPALVVLGLTSGAGFAVVALLRREAPTSLRNLLVLGVGLLGAVGLTWWMYQNGGL